MVTTEWGSQWSQTDPRDFDVYLKDGSPGKNTFCKVTGVLTRFCCGAHRTKSLPLLVGPAIEKC
jgi:hypothetical protein